MTRLKKKQQTCENEKQRRNFRGAEHEGLGISSLANKLNNRYYVTGKRLRTIRSLGGRGESKATSSRWKERVAGKGKGWSNQRGRGKNMEVDHLRTESVTLGSEDMLFFSLSTVTSPNSLLTIMPTWPDDGFSVTRAWRLNADHDKSHIPRMNFKTRIDKTLNKSTSKSWIVPCDKFIFLYNYIWGRRFLKASHRCHFLVARLYTLQSLDSSVFELLALLFTLKFIIEKLS